MANGDPLDGLVYPILKLVKNSYNTKPFTTKDWFLYYDIPHILKYAPHSESNIRWGPMFPWHNDATEGQCYLTQVLTYSCEQYICCIECELKYYQSTSQMSLDVYDNMGRTLYSCISFKSTILLYKTIRAHS